MLEFFLRGLGQLGFLLGWDWLNLIVLSFPLLGDLALLGVTVLRLLSVTVGVYVLGLAWRKGKEGETLDLSYREFVGKDKIGDKNLLEYLRNLVSQLRFQPGYF